ncbi:MAG: hypothetical protein K1X89_01830 [Myxococcaceae bacterium]|nr:hypothetical protein [Myxococcaceae bacterium]
MATRRAQECRVDFSGALNSGDFEKTLAEIRGARRSRGRFTFDLDGTTFAQLDVLVSLLFVCNELCAEGNAVTLQWAETKVRTYADRIGFFEHLAEEVTVIPDRPAGRLYRRYRSNNQQILEMTALPPGDDRQAAGDALTSLNDSLAANLDGAASDKVIADIWTFASEALDNIFEHADARRAGVVAAQRYESPTRGSRLQLVIADAGLGVLSTLRDGNPQAASLPDRELLLAAFREGLSRKKDRGRGCGLVLCAQVAARYGANLTVRSGEMWAMLVTKSAKTGISIGIFNDEVAPVVGTQITLELYLDRLAGHG